MRTSSPITVLLFSEKLFSIVRLRTKIHGVLSCLHTTVLIRGYTVSSCNFSFSFSENLDFVWEKAYPN
jgi:hypothetical protein